MAVGVAVAASLGSKRQPAAQPTFAALSRHHRGRAFAYRAATLIYRLSPFPMKETTPQDAAAAQHDTTAQAQPSAAEAATSTAPQGEPPTPPSTDWKEKYVRLYADFDNYKKRLAREQRLWATMAAEGLITQLLPVLDDLERALQSLQGQQESHKGVLLIYSKLQKLLEQQGLTPVAVKVGDAVDTTEHQTLTQLPTDKVELQGKILEVVEKGYRLHGKLLRAAKVILGATS